jgi:3D (Asp-Asp-Asp) domain-containing protein
MKSLVRGGIILITLSLFAVFVYAQTRSEKVLSIANDSHKEVTNKAEAKESETDLNAGNTDRKLVKTTAMVMAVKSASRGAFSATAYCLSGRTALGHSVRRGIVAADPRVLKLGSKVLITAGSYTGQYLVSDTGGGVKGKELDIWVPSCSEARRFGRRTVTLSVIE